MIKGKFIQFILALFNNENIFGQPAMYEDLSCMAFVNGYLSVMALQPESTKPKMFMHLQEMMENGEAYG